MSKAQLSRSFALHHAALSMLKLESETPSSFWRAKPPLSRSLAGVHACSGTPRAAGNRPRRHDRAGRPPCRPYFDGGSNQNSLMVGPSLAFRMFRRKICPVTGVNVTLARLPQVVPLWNVTHSPLTWYCSS